MDRAVFPLPLLKSLFYIFDFIVQAVAQGRILHGFQCRFRDFGAGNGGIRPRLYNRDRAFDRRLCRAGGFFACPFCYSFGGHG